MEPASVLVVENDPEARERIKQELRELGYTVGESHSDDQVSAGGICIDIPGHRVVIENQFITLTPREYRLLLFFVNNQDRVFSRKQLLANVWDRDASIGARTVDVHIRRLRSVLEPSGHDCYLQTVRGTGYRFSVTQP
jgi:two-component system phosphate regulon response regulator PhoB